MAKKIIIFDFDGTLADTLPYYIRTMNSLSCKYGYKKISKARENTLKDMRPKEILDYLGISIIDLCFIINTVKASLNEKIEFFTPTVPIREVLLKLKKNGYRLGIITSNSKDNVDKFLKNNRLNLFDFVHSGSSIFGKGRVISGFLKDRNIKPKEAIYVGDEIMDIEAAKEAEIDIIAVSWGFNSKQALKELQPDFLINTPKELMEIFENKPKKMKVRS